MKNKLGILLSTDSSNLELIPAAARIGFDCFFTGYDDNVYADIAEWKKAAQAHGMEYETLHAPFSNVNSIWREGADGDEYAKMVCRCIDCASENNIGKIIMHLTHGGIAPPVSKIGFDRIEMLIRYAERKNVIIAFENVANPAYVGYVLDKFDSPMAGFCFDCGHQHCMTPMVDVLSMNGSRLVCTHINDNIGVTASPEKWNSDDVHWLPFDGNINYKAICNKLNELHYDGPLTLELTYKAPNKTYHMDMTRIEFMEEAYKRAVKLASLCK